MLPANAKKPWALLCLVALLVPAFCGVASGSDEVTDVGTQNLLTSRDGRFHLGTGYGIVRFDVNAKLTDKASNSSVYVDFEGNLGLDEHSSVRVIYGSYRIAAKHSVVFSYFDVRRSSTVIDFDGTYEDLTIRDATLELEDLSRFYGIGYGYKLFQNEHNGITLVAGLNVLDLRLTAEASGEIINDGVSLSQEEFAEADTVAPLPLIGLNFTTAYTPRWSLSTKVALIAGSYQDISAQIFEIAITSRYQFSKHVGLLLGLTYFSAEVDEEDSDELLDVSYAYDGIFIGLHFGL